MGSRLKSSTQRALDLYLRMGAIKKKMQAMKVEKDNACVRCDACEEASKVAKLRAEKAEEEVLELMNKARQLETELDVTTERLSLITSSSRRRKSPSWPLRLRSTPSTDVSRVLKRTWRRLRRNSCSPTRSLTRLPPPLMTLNV